MLKRIKKVIQIKKKTPTEELSQQQQSQLQVQNLKTMTASPSQSPLLNFSKLTLIETQEENNPKEENTAADTLSSEKFAQIVGIKVIPDTYFYKLGEATSNNSTNENFTNEQKSTNHYNTNKIDSQYPPKLNVNMFIPPEEEMNWIQQQNQMTVTSNGSDQTGTISLEESFANFRMARSFSVPNVQLHSPQASSFTHHYQTQNGHGGPQQQQHQQQSYHYKSSDYYSNPATPIQQFHSLPRIFVPSSNSTNNTCSSVLSSPAGYSSTFSYGQDSNKSPFKEDDISKSSVLKVSTVGRFKVTKEKTAHTSPGRHRWMSAHQGKSRFSLVDPVQSPPISPINPSALSGSSFNNTNLNNNDNNLTACSFQLSLNSNATGRIEDKCLYIQRNRFASKDSGVYVGYFRRRNSIGGYNNSGKIGSSNECI